MGSTKLILRINLVEPPTLFHFTLYTTLHDSFLSLLSLSYSAACLGIFYLRLMAMPAVQCGCIVPPSFTISLVLGATSLPHDVNPCRT